MNEMYIKLWHLLEDVEDHYEGGFRRTHVPVELVEPPKTDPASEPASDADTLEAIAAEIADCRLCGLGSGNLFARQGFSFASGTGARETRFGKRLRRRS